MRDREGIPLEEKYYSMSRGGSRQEEPPQHNSPSRRSEPPRRRRSAAPKGKRCAAGNNGRPRRSRAAAVGIGAYKLLVLVSAVIVAAYIGLQLASKPPEQTPVGKPDPIPGTVVSDDGGSGSSSSGQEPEALVRKENVFNILLAATDAEGFRTDVMMVMQYDTERQKVGVVSIPRDTITRRAAGKNPHLVYGAGGVTQRVEDIANMLGITIDYYIEVDISGFIALVDYLGGVEVEIPLDMNYDDPYQNLHIHFTKGTHLLDGQEAMEVARYRHDNEYSPNYQANQWYTDVQRTEMQQMILTQLAKKVLSWDSLSKINGFVEIFNQYVETDLTMGHMLWFAEKALGLDIASGVETATLEGRGDAIYQGFTWCFELAPDQTVETVNRLINPYTRDLTLEDMDILAADSYYFGA